MDDIPTILLREIQARKQEKSRHYEDMCDSVKGLEKRFRTSFIGNLSQIEEEFGFLWGHGTPYDDLGDGQKKFRAKWNSLRERMLDHSNNQMRLAVKELIKILN